MANSYTYTKEKRDPQIQWYKTNSGLKRWRVKFTQVHNGKKISIERQGFKNFDEARKFKADSVMQIESNMVTNTKQYTVEEYWNLFLKNKIATGRWKRTTIQSTISYFNVHILPDWGKKKLNQISRIDFQEWIIDHAKKRNLSKYTADMIKHRFFALMQDAVINDLIPKNPIQKIEVVGAERRDLSLSREQFEKIVHFAYHNESLDPVERAIIVLALHGLRRSEITGLKLKYVESDRVGIFGQINPYGDYTTPKTRSSRRWVPLMKDAIPVINEAIAYSRGLYLYRNSQLTDDDYVLVNQMAHYYSGNAVTQLFNFMSNELGFHVAPHMLRHAFSTFAFSIPGVNPRDISNVLGHKNIDMSAYYNLGTDDGKREVIDLFNDVAMGD